MTKLIKNGTTSMWVGIMTIAIVACLGGIAYTFYMMQQEAGEDGESRMAADELRILSQTVSLKARETDLGQPSTFSQLQSSLLEFRDLMGELQAIGLDRELSDIQAQWLPVEQAAETLVDAGPRIVFIHGVSQELEKNIKPIQSEFAEVVDILRDETVTADTIVAAQTTLWLTERIARNIEKILAGGAESQLAVDEFRSDAANFSRIVDALKNGNRVMGVQRLTDPDAIESINVASNLFSVVSTSIEQIESASAELRKAAAARTSIIESNAALVGTVAALAPAIDRLTTTRMGDRGTLMALFAAPGVLAVGLLVAMFRGQRKRVLYTEEGVAEINRVLVKIAEGDLTVSVPEDNTVTREIAKEINTSTKRQRELIMNIRTPFRVSVDEIGKIGKTATDQVDKGRELTRSVVDSTTAATEMVRTSEEIKTSTAEAARTSERNSARVAKGYELTKDMSKASADVRESVQETSKSAKRQGELIQSVTTAAEYIQALNTKISVVAINTRIEAEKAGEHGRPFLGIAEAIGDLLREAEEEGRKIITEVRMLQNMSADNLSSMENTVGTVVTILEYIDRLDSSLEDINEGSTAITAIVTSVDDAAGQSADSARHMNSSMSEIRERNLEISEFSENTQGGVGALQKSMRDVAENLSQFKIETDDVPEKSVRNAVAHKVYAEDEMSALETADEERLSV
ncbi:MAG: methyl-accepting chemotaxis protein [Proteobacteria bacterium]|nr:methyl-accepting chemotaxis protein [Pseudomonadota bacterium]